MKPNVDLTKQSESKSNPVWDATKNALTNGKNYRDLFKIALACTLNVVLGNANPWINAFLTGGSVMVTYFDEQFTLEQNTRKLRQAQKSLKQKPSSRLAINWPTYLGVFLGAVSLVFYFMLNLAPEVFGASAEAAAKAVTALIVLATALPSLSRKYNVSYIQHQVESLEEAVHSKQDDSMEKGLSEQAIQKAEEMQALEREQEQEEIQLAATAPKGNDQPDEDLILEIVEEKQKLERQIEDLNQLLISANSEAEKFADKSNRMENELEALASELASTQQELKSKNDEVDSLNQVRLKQQEEILSLKEEQDKILQGWSLKQNELFQTKMELSDTARDLDMTKQALQTTNIQLEESQSKLAKMQLALEAALKNTNDKVEKGENKTTSHSITFFASSLKVSKIGDGKYLSRSLDSLESNASKKEINTSMRPRSKSE